MLASHRAKVFQSGQCTVRNTLNVSSLAFDETYLGLPIPEGRMKNGKFQSINDNIGKS